MPFCKSVEAAYVTTSSQEAQAGTRARVKSQALGAPHFAHSQLKSRIIMRRSGGSRDYAGSDCEVSGAGILSKNPKLSSLNKDVRR